MLDLIHNHCMIDPRLTTLRTFEACGTIFGTAELTGLSPSAVSAQLRELQRSLGMQLLVKDGRGLRLTPAGRELVAGSDALIAVWERLRSSVMREGQETQTRFAIGGFSTATANLLAPLGAWLRKTRPELEVQVFEADPDRCLELLIAERLDLAVIISMQTGQHTSDDERFESVELLDDPLDVMVPSDHRFAGRASVSLEEVAGEHWISDAPGGPYRALFTAAFMAVGRSPRVVHEVIEWEAAVALVRAGMGLGLVPRLFNLAPVEGVTRVRISGPSRPVRRIVAVVRRGTADSELVRESLDALRANAAEIMRTRLAEASAAPAT